MTVIAGTAFNRGDDSVNSLQHMRFARSSPSPRTDHLIRAIEDMQRRLCLFIRETRQCITGRDVLRLLQRPFGNERLELPLPVLGELQHGHFIA